MKKILLCLLFLWAANFANAQSNPDSVTFETPIPAGVIRIESGSLWQIGSPHKTFFSSAHHGSRAIVTDTVNPYPANDTSRFIYTLYPPYISTCGTQFTFWQKYDMDLAGDKGIIEASYDGGASWIELKDTSAFTPLLGPFYFDWAYDYHESDGSYTMHNLYSLGNSNGWILSGFEWQWFIPVKSDTIIINPDSLMIRFTFISDSIVKNKEGWMIDDIGVSFATLCSGIIECPYPDDIQIYPNPSRGIFNLRFIGTVEATKVEVLNSVGQLVMRKDVIAQKSAMIDLSEEAKGLYFIKLENGNRVEVRKVILE